MVIALFSTIPLLICMGYFFMGSLPLLILNHDTPLDSRFIRGFFNTYYLALAGAAIFATISCVLAGQLAYAAGMAAVAALAFILRRFVLRHMDILRVRIENADAGAATDFRRAHVAGMAVNFIQLVAVVWGMFQISR
jgi:hypothetical protein